MESQVSFSHQNIGIILKNQYSTHQCAWIFDNTLGKILVKTSMHTHNHIHRVHPGSIIRYHIQTYRHWYILSSVDFIHMPYTLACHNLPFFQLMVQLCLYCLPKSCMAQELFDFMYYTYTQKKLTRAQQILCLFRFFDLIGIYEEPIPTTTDYLTKIPLPHFLQEKLDDSCQRMIESWIVRCTAVYPIKQVEALMRTINLVSYEV